MGSNIMRLITGHYEVTLLFTMELKNTCDQRVKLTRNMQHNNDG